MRPLYPCLAGNFKGLCKQIDHFPEDADYEADTAEYFLRECATGFHLTPLLPSTLPRAKDQADPEGTVTAEGSNMSPWEHAGIFLQAVPTPTLTHSLKHSSLPLLA